MIPDQAMLDRVVDGLEQDKTNLKRRLADESAKLQKAEQLRSDL